MLINVCCSLTEHKQCSAAVQAKMKSSQKNSPDLCQDCLEKFGQTKTDTINQAVLEPMIIIGAYN